MMIPIILLAILLLAVLSVYIRFWLRGVMPMFRRMRVLTCVLTVVLAVGSICIFTTPGLVLLHFWMVSFLWELPMLLIRLVSGKRLAKWLRVCVPVLLTAVAVVWGSWNMAHPIRTDYVYETDKPIRPEGYRVVLITDTHYDTIQDPALLKDSIPQINFLKPDFVVLGGDIVEEGTSKEKMEEVFEVLGDIRSSFGSFYIFGNHDRQTYSGSPKYTVEELVDAIERNGIAVMKNTYTTVNDEILLVGMEDPSWNREDPRVDAGEILADTEWDGLIVVADHQPDFWRANKDAGMDLQLSGHTHAGQIWPVGQVLGLFGRMNYGRYDREGITAIVSSGFTGWGFPIRTSERCEYVVIDIVPAKTAETETVK